uniref:Uncharacterized protein n=1 Tax=Pyxicephalus adspersus TaxID=30357 RepID=A0AAV3AGV1_PYXAD|nr:TPA: hypothetical protein GDO54_011152 [Pyxicephalus adspersus]
MDALRHPISFLRSARSDDVARRRKRIEQDGDTQCSLRIRRKEDSRMVQNPIKDFSYVIKGSAELKKHSRSFLKQKVFACLITPTNPKNRTLCPRFRLVGRSITNSFLMSLSHLQYLLYCDKQKVTNKKRLIYLRSTCKPLFTFSINTCTDD